MMNRRPGFRLNKWVLLAILVAVAVAFYVASMVRIASLE